LSISFYKLNLCLGDKAAVLLGLVVFSVSLCNQLDSIIMRSDLRVEHTGCCQTPYAYKNLTGIL